MWQHVDESAGQQLDSADDNTAVYGRYRLKLDPKERVGHNWKRARDSCGQDQSGIRDFAG